MFNNGYEFNQVDRKLNTGDQFLVCTWKYNFQAEHHRYVVEVEMYQSNIFIVKYYAICHSKSKNRYRMIVNEGHPGRVMRTCIDIMLKHYEYVPLASFGFIGMNSCNKKKKGKKIQETVENTQRFRIYKSLVSNFFGEDTFFHSQNSKFSAYLLINKKVKGTEQFKSEAETMFKKIYTNFLND